MAIRRTRQKRESDILKTNQMAIAGATQAEISAVVGVSQQTVSRDLKELRRRWMATAMVDIDEHRAKSLAKLNEVERHFWLRYRESNKDTAMAERWLSGVLRTIAQRSKLMGENRPDGILLGVQTREQISVEFVNDWRAERQARIELQWPDSEVTQEHRDRSIAALAVAIGNAGQAGADVIDGEAVQITETAQDGPGHAQELTGDGETPQGIVDALQESDEDAAELAALQEQLAQIQMQTAIVNSQIEGARR